MTHTMIDRPAQPPMPATNCPDWCQRDHYKTWTDRWELLSVPQPVTWQDGTVTHTTPITAEELTANFLEDLCHSKTLYATRTTEGDTIGLALEADATGQWLYLDAEGSLDRHHALSLADALRDAATLLEVAR